MYRVWTKSQLLYRFQYTFPRICIRRVSFIEPTIRSVFEPAAYHDTIRLSEVQIKRSCNYWYHHFSVSLDPIGPLAQPFVGISKRRRIEELVSIYSLYWNASRCFRLFRRGFSFSLPSHCGSPSPSLSPHYNFLFSPLVYCRSHPFSSRLHYFPFLRLNRRDNRTHSSMNYLSPSEGGSRSIE